MELTRRDAVAALAAAGVAVGGGGAVVLSGRTGGDPDGDGSGSPIGEDELSTLVAAAEVLYPSGVDNVEGFVTRFVRERAADRPDHGRATAAAAAYLDEYARAWYEEPFAALDRPERDEALRAMNADTAAPDPGGSDVERIRYYVVDELLFALYSTPTGGELVGIENPQGHPGGLASYRRGPGP